MLRYVGHKSMRCQGHKIERHLVTFTGIKAANFIKLTPKPSLKNRTASTIFWKYHGIFTDYGLKTFFRTKTFSFFKIES